MVALDMPEISHIKMVNKSSFPKQIINQNFGFDLYRCLVMQLCKPNILHSQDIYFFKQLNMHLPLFNFRMNFALHACNGFKN